MSSKLIETNKEAFNFAQIAALPLKIICEPLFRNLGLTVFAYIRAYFDGRMLHISTNAEWEKIFFNHQFYNEQDCFHKLRQTTALYGFKKLILTGNPIGPHCQALCDFNIWNTFSIYQRKEDYIEGWAFGTTRDNCEIINLYLNESKNLNKFVLYFNEKAKSIITIDDPKKLIQTAKKINVSSEQNQNSIQQFIEELNLTKIPLETPNGTKYLSCREVECLKFLSHGESYKQAAKKMRISPRTVEYYIDNIKKKTGYRFKNDLIQLYQNNPIYWL